MGKPSDDSSDGSVFGNVVYRYSRQQALDDGVLIDPGDMANEAGFRWPVALTAAVWNDCVLWNDADSRQQIYQDQSGRLWDVLYMAINAIRTNKTAGNRLMYQLYRVPRNGKALEAELVTLKLIVGPGDSGEPVVTILLPEED